MITALQIMYLTAMLHVQLTAQKPQSVTDAMQLTQEQKLVQYSDTALQTMYQTAMQHVQQTAQKPQNATDAKQLIQEQKQIQHSVIIW